MSDVTPSVSPVAPRRIRSQVIALRQLSETGFELTLERHGLPFRAGQLLNIHGPHMLDDRSYTICSGEQDEHLQIVFRLIPTGRLTPYLASLRAGDVVACSGPYGEFVVRDVARPLFFVATGTGIAPARAFRRSHPALNMMLLHGVRVEEDLFYREEFAAGSYHACVSGGTDRFFAGRVTERCAALDLPENAHYYLCGANEMFYDMRDVLRARKIPETHIFTEAYYYRADD